MAKECSHIFHFVRIIDVPFYCNLNRDGLKPQAEFICEKCGLLKRVEVRDGL
jgi:hypothetical protein